MTKKLRYFCTLLLMAVVGVAWADEVVYKTALFGSDYNSKTVSSYTDTWTATNDGFVVTLANFNNNNNVWDYVKCGRKNNASVATITTGAVEEAITKVDVTIDAITAAKVNSIKLYISSDNSNWSEAGSYTKASGVQTVSLSSPAADLYYKIEFDCASASSNGLVTVSKVEYYYDDTPASGDTPSITAENVNINFDATEGEIAYVINNGVDGGALNASVTDGDWLTLSGTNFESPIAFTCDANETKDARTATVTLTYTYDNESVTKNVTVTQAANPNVIDKIENISESGVFYVVKGTVVATSARAFVIGDGTGFIYTYLGSAPSWSVGDMVKISGTTSSYNQVIQFPNSATITVATESEYTPLTPAAMTEVPDYTSGLYKSDYYQFEGMLTKEGNYYVVAVGEGQIRISYPSTSQTTELDDLLNKMVKVNGFFAGNSANGSGVFTAIMESIEEVVSDEPSITLASYEVEENANAHTTQTTIAVTYANIDFENNVPKVVFYESDGSTEAIYDWLFVDLDADWNVYYTIEENTSNAARTAYFKVLGYDSNGNNVYSDLASITQAAAPAVAHCYYSVNGVVGTEQEATVGTPVTLEAGEDLDANFTFAGWTTDPNVVEPLLTQYTFNANEVVTFYAVYAHTNSGATQSEASYVKVTSTDEIVDGNYLIVAEGTYADETSYQVAFDGSLTTLDATFNTIDVTIENDMIAASETVDASVFTIDVTNGTLMSASGFYIGVTTNSNGLKQNENAETYNNTFAIDEDGNADIYERPAAHPTLQVH